jgi:hypothetical protein
VHLVSRRLILFPEPEVMITFPADIPGVFEVELHDSGLVLAQLEVS